MAFYFLEGTFGFGAGVAIGGLVLFVAVHLLVLLVKAAAWFGGADTEENNAKRFRCVVVGTSIAGLASVCGIYACGTAFSTDWSPYVDGLVIGGLSAALHFMPLRKTGRQASDSDSSARQ